MGESALAFVREQAAEMARIRGGMGTCEDADAVHDLRVSIRTARSAIRSFGAFLPSGVTALDEPLKAVFRRLGEVRDWDIALGHWAKLGPGDAGSGEVKAVLERRRESARRQAARAVSAPCAIDALGAAVRVPNLRSGGATVTPEAAAPDLVEAALARAKKAARGASGGGAAEIHLFRRRVKRLRYTLDSFSDLYGREAKACLREMKATQDLTGRFMDTVGFSRRLMGLRKLSVAGRRAAEAAERKADREAQRLASRIAVRCARFGGGTWKALGKRMVAQRRALWKAEE